MLLKKAPRGRAGPTGQRNSAENPVSRAPSRHVWGVFNCLLNYFGLTRQKTRDFAQKRLRFFGVH